MAQVFAIGDVVNDEERKAIAWLKEKLPDDYFVIHSIVFEMILEKLIAVNYQPLADFYC